MASERRQEQPTPSTSRIGPNTPGHITTRGVTPGPESSQPQRFPTDDEQNRSGLLASNDSRSSLPKLTQHPEDINIEIPPPAAVTLTRSPQPDAPAFPARPSIYPTNGPRSELDWIVPVEPKRERTKTLHERLSPTLETAKIERGKYELKAKMTGYALNIAIGIQVILGSLTTGLSAATSGRQTSITIAILGGFSTVVASYLARARGSNEPELSITRCKDLEQYIRECEIFILDFGHLTGNEYDPQLTALRERFEELLGNANGERRLAPV
ncbi:hypothetical protein DFH07DRAFT_98518 [Mycena maculata]|uniref:SMODS and SLOG-associating 2TM effector domain-containing protein n=1 Tax=Mycena maculata TaxID=230809 RepID=A0AAD7I7Z5_9AGAR|nr:hypothetical protein DFH07DRAFT_98518 [Mycena maculata]